MTAGFRLELFDQRLVLSALPVMFAADKCWPWAGPCNPVNGYGYQGHNYAHRISYRLAKGPIPDGLTIDHLCRNVSCINPAHLEAVTQAENNRRAHSPNECKRGHSRWAVARNGRRYCAECNRLKQAAFRATGRAVI